MHLLIDFPNFYLHIFKIVCCILVVCGKGLIYLSMTKCKTGKILIRLQGECLGGSGYSLIAKVGNPIM